MGFDLSEVVEEYVMENGVLTLVKRKVTKKDVPPDIKAVKMLFGEGEDVSQMTDEMLENEKKRLLEELKKKE